jgi:hypothetical protein
LVPAAEYRSYPANFKPVAGATTTDGKKTGIAGKVGAATRIDNICRYRLWVDIGA